MDSDNSTTLQDALDLLGKSPLKCASAIGDSTGILPSAFVRYKKHGHKDALKQATEKLLPSIELLSKQMPEKTLEMALSTLETVEECVDKSARLEKEIDRLKALTLKK